ncbi:LGFP repeat-containing protein, partial [Paenibacillus sp. TAF43_2]|uniref:LGFP repeat-containing protein n=1 Tax=Paenibacillus sp. TAF43_2 TaxID=3233069 RepID=UPI003F9E1276
RSTIIRGRGPRRNPTASATPPRPETGTITGTRNPNSIRPARRAHERSRLAARSGSDITKAQQRTLTVPVENLPELPAGTVARSEKEPIPEGFSKEEADLSERMALVAAADCQFYWPSPHAVCGAIRDKYNAMGGPGSFLNFPTSPEYQNPGNTGARSEFVNGSIYWSAATGAHPVTLLYMNKWAQHNWEAGWMGYPTTDEFVNLDNIGSRQEFQGAAIYWHPLQSPLTAVIGGAIRDKWNATGAEIGTLGYPTTDEKPLAKYNGRYNDFFLGAIYWSSVTNAHSIDFDVLRLWRDRGGEQGFYGYPTGDTNRDGLFTTWLTQNFEQNNVVAYRPF